MSLKRPAAGEKFRMWDFNYILFIYYGEQMIKYVYIKKEYFEERASYIKMLDPGEPGKQQHRSYLFVGFLYNENRFYIPLRNHLGNVVRPFGKIGYPVPSSTRQDAGLDYRYMLIVNDDSYIEIPSTQRIPVSQSRIMKENYDSIVEEAAAYVSGFVKTAKKGRVDRKAKYRASSLVNFYEELGI